MSTTADLRARVEALGGRLEARGDRLRVEAPAPLPAGLVAELRRHKPGLLAALRGEHTITLEELLRPDVRPCRGCGHLDTWVDTRSGRRICRMCHPPLAADDAVRTLSEEIDL